MIKIAFGKDQKPPSEPKEEAVPIADKKKADVTGDGIIDKVMLSGTRPKNRPAYWEGLHLIIQEGKTGYRFSFPLKTPAGYSPKLFLGDLNGDKVADILISVPTTLSEGPVRHEAYSFRTFYLDPLFDPEAFNRGLPFSVTFWDGWQVKVRRKNSDLPWKFPVSERQSFYRELGIYDKKGKLLKPAEGEVLALEQLIPADLNRNGTFSLLARQRIIGPADRVPIGTMETLWNWEVGGFQPLRIEGVPSIPPRTERIPPSVP
jgi:hypothetical protein